MECKKQVSRFCVHPQKRRLPLYWNALTVFTMIIWDTTHGSQMSILGVFLYQCAFHLIFWDRVSHWTSSSHICLDCLPASTRMPLFPWPCLAFTWVSEVWTQVLKLPAANTSHTELSPQRWWRWFKKSLSHKHISLQPIHLGQWFFKYYLG